MKRGQKPSKQAISEKDNAPFLNDQGKEEPGSDRGKGSAQRCEEKKARDESLRPYGLGQMGVENSRPMICIL
jgi:hypothetical protein